jgi:hypothetical protein
MMRPFTLFVALTGLLICTSERSATQTSAVAGRGKKVTVGAFMVMVPTEWASFGSSEAAALRQQYTAQSRQIYQQYNSGSSDGLATPIGLAAFNIAGDDGAFIIVSFAVPPQSDLINMLKNQTKAKMDFGIRQGYIRKYLGLVPVDDEQFSGFYTTAIGKDGNVEVSGGLEHKKLKNTVIQLTLLCPKTWDQSRATDTLTAILKSVSLGGVK